jgi:predicted 3-demethylubiquinone-9 3-methyltransferase (glyoxalase superfamily)
LGAWDGTKIFPATSTKARTMHEITPCLWFDTQAEEAANHYVSIFKNSEIGEVSRYGEGAPMPAGTALVVNFILNGSPFQTLNGGPVFTFSGAISFSVGTETQEETDELWEKLISGGGEPSQCGWLKDKYGVSWQIVPSVLGELLSDPDQAKAGRVMQAMLGMSKIEIAGLRAAYDAG